MGGSIVTAGGLVFIAATTDSKFRAFDSHTGRELWVAKLEATGDAVPMTYMGRNGQQYVVIAAGGTNRFRMIANTASQTSDALIAFSLQGEGPASFPTEAVQIAPARTVSPPPPSDISSAQALPEAPGKSLVLRVCTKCHGVSVFTKLRMGRVGWSNEVAAMIEKGAVATDQEVNGIVEYLAANFR